MRIRILILIAVFIAPVSFAGEPSASHLAAAEELLIVTRVEQMMDSALDTTLRLQLESNPALVDYEEVMRDFLARHITWKALRVEMVRMYAESFTEGELKDLIAFNKTPVGQKAVRLMPELFARGSQLGQQRVQENMAELQELVRQRQKQLNDE